MTDLELEKLLTKYDNDRLMQYTEFVRATQAILGDHVEAATYWAAVVRMGDETMERPANGLEKTLADIKNFFAEYDNDELAEYAAFTLGTQATHGKQVIAIAKAHNATVVQVGDNVDDLLEEVHKQTLAALVTARLEEVHKQTLAALETARADTVAGFAAYQEKLASEYYCTSGASLEGSDNENLESSAEAGNHGTDSPAN
jgi:hypothetical protein